MDKNYYNYLVNKLDRGLSGNPAIEETGKIIKKIGKNGGIVSILDIGCFSGSLINRLYNNLPKDLKNRLRLVGLDTYNDALKRGVKNYPQITFIKGNLLEDLPLVKQYDIIILSNVLHEIFSDTVKKTKNYTSTKRKIKKSLDQVIDILNKGGYLIILDGVKPPAATKKIVISFKTKAIFNKFIKFSQEYKAKSIEFQRLSHQSILTETASLAAFLTKSRYLDKTYWEKESEELYQYFTINEFKQLLQQEEIKIIKIKRNKFTKREIKEKIISIRPDIEIPAKNILIVAQKK